MSNKELQLEGKYPNPFSQNELKTNTNLGMNLNENVLSELNDQMTELTLGYESKYRKESSPLPQNPMKTKVAINPSDNNLISELELKPNSYMHKMSEGSLNDMTKGKNTFWNTIHGNNRDGNKILKVNGNSDKYLPHVNYIGNSQTSPICSYYDSSQKYFSHSLQKDTQNEELVPIPESHNFIRKSSIEDDMEPKAYQQQEIGNSFDDNEGLNGYEEYINPNSQAFNQNYLDMKYNFFNPNNQQQTQKSPQINPSLIPNYSLPHQNLFRPNQQMNKAMKKAKGNQNQFDLGAYNMETNNQNDQEDGNNNLIENDNHSSEEDNSNQSIHSDDYIFEKYGKKGWMCEKCNNFNFENRKNCNRCGIPKQPKLLSKIKEKNHNNFPNPFKTTQALKLQMSMEEKKRKPFTERKGDWRCSQCHNLNFAFRLICNMCQLPQYQSAGMNMTKPNKNMNNFPQQPQIPIQMPNQPQIQMQFQPQLPYQLQQHPRMQQNQVNPFYQNMLNNQINIYNNYYSMMHQNMLNKKQNQFNSHQQ